MGQSIKERCGSIVLLLWCTFLCCGCWGVVVVFTCLSICNLAGDDEESRIEPVKEEKKKKKKLKFPWGKKKARERKTEAIKLDEGFEDPIENAPEFSTPSLLDTVKHYFPPPKFLTRGLVETPQDNEIENASAPSFNPEYQESSFQDSGNTRNSYVNVSAIVDPNSIPPMQNPENVYNPQPVTEIQYPRIAPVKVPPPKPAVLEENAIFSNIFSYFVKANKFIKTKIAKEEDYDIDKKENLTIETNPIQKNDDKGGTTIKMITEVEVKERKEEVKKESASTAIEGGSASTPLADGERSSEYETVTDDEEGESEFETETETEEEEEKVIEKVHVEIIENAKEEFSGESEGETEYETVTEEENEETEENTKEINDKNENEENGEESFIETTISKITSLKDSVFSFFGGTSKENTSQEKDGKGL